MKLTGRRTGGEKNRRGEEPTGRRGDAETRGLGTHDAAVPPAMRGKSLTYRRAYFFLF